MEGVRFGGSKGVEGEGERGEKWRVRGVKGAGERGE